MPNQVKKRILILIADAGFGHRSAANAIVEALQATHGDECEAQIVNPMEDEHMPSFLRNSQSDYDRIVREAPDLYKLGYEASDAAVPSVIVESALTVMMFEVMRDMLKRYQPDAIVTTYPLYQYPLSAAFAIQRSYVPLVTVVTDLATVHRLWFHDAADRCLVPTATVRDLAVEYGIAPDKVQITGIPVHPSLVQEIRPPSAVRSELGWRPNLTTVLAVGSKRVEHMAEVLHVLNHSGLPLQLAVVAGGDEDLYGQFQATEWHVPTHVFNFVDNMPTLMHAAECIICKAGGLIVTESLACGLPLLLIDVLPGQEEGNAEMVVQGGAGELAASPIEALEAMCHWLEHDGALLAQRAQNACSLGRPRAALDVAEQAWQAARRGPHARPRRRLLSRSSLVTLLRRFDIPWM
jgi:1,2-diacylglycerol 3-beta-galactosyltransferase